MMNLTALEFVLLVAAAPLVGALCLALGYYGAAGCYHAWRALARRREATRARLAANDAAIRCAHGQKKWQPCRACAEAAFPLAEAEGHEWRKAQAARALVDGIPLELRPVNDVELAAELYEECVSTRRHDLKNVAWAQLKAAPPGTKYDETLHDDPDDKRVPAVQVGAFRVATDARGALIVQPLRDNVDDVVVRTGPARAPRRVSVDRGPNSQLEPVWDRDAARDPEAEAERFALTTTRPLSIQLATLQGWLARRGVPALVLHPNDDLLYQLRVIRDWVAKMPPEKVASEWRRTYGHPSEPDATTLTVTFRG